MNLVVGNVVVSKKVVLVLNRNHNHNLPRLFHNFNLRAVLPKNGCYDFKYNFQTSSVNCTFIKMISLTNKSDMINSETNVLRTSLFQQMGFIAYFLKNVAGILKVK